MARSVRVARGSTRRKTTTMDNIETQPETPPTPYEPPADELRLALRAAPDKVRTPSNKRFAKLPAAQQRVAIARDVLQWLKLGKLTAKSNTYLIVRKDDGSTVDYDSVDNVNGFKCDACALGAVFACAVEREVATTQRFTIHESNGSKGFQWSTREALSPYFDTLQLTLIECAFERSSSFLDYTAPGMPATASFTPERDALRVQSIRAAKLGKDIEDAIPWDLYQVEGLDTIDKRERYRDARVMRAIMQNIIDNDGTFVP